MGAIKLWAENIIIVVIISIIIEMILPEGNSKKYVKVVRGVYLLYVIINPILNIDLNLDVNEITNSIVGNETVLTSSTDVKNSYIAGLEITLKEQIEKNLRLYSKLCKN